MRVVISVLAVVVAVAAGCATTPPAELIQARTALNRASFGPAAQLAPADLHKASLALDLAERAFADERNLPKAVDLAYIAERTAQIAEAHAETALTEKKMATQAAGTLTTARAQLAEARRGEAQLAQQVGVERTAREAAEQKADASEQKADASEQKAGASDEKAAASEQRAQQANGRPRQVVRQGRRARHGDNALGKCPVSFQRGGAPSRGDEASRRGGKRPGGPGAERRRRRLHGLEGLAVEQRRSVAAPCGSGPDVSRLPRMPAGPDRGARPGTGSPDRGQRERRGTRQQSSRRDRHQSAVRRTP